MSTQGMTRGRCLCGGVRFEITRADGPFELCHCNRCRKASGSAYAAGLYVRADRYRLERGGELIGEYEAPILEAPPAYRVRFCTRCGSPLPVPSPDGVWYEVPAGLLDDDPQVRPDKHIYVECKAPWEDITDELPRLTAQQIREQRQKQEPE